MHQTNLFSTVETCDLLSPINNSLQHFRHFPQWFMTSYINYENVSQPWLQASLVWLILHLEFSLSWWLQVCVKLTAEADWWSLKQAFRSWPQRDWQEAGPGMRRRKGKALTEETRPCEKGFASSVSQLQLECRAWPWVCSERIKETLVKGGTEDALRINCTGQG